MPVAAIPQATDRNTLIHRVNQLYHEHTQASFDVDHRSRHRVECSFWRAAGRRLVNDLRAHAGDGRGLVIVDLGCGTGFVTCLVGALLGPADRVIAVDVAAAALRSTRAKWDLLVAGGGPRLELMSADAADLPMPDAGADAVVMNASLHHLPRPQDALREIDRVLAPGGCFALGHEPNRNHFASGVMRTLSRGVDRAAWYGSPRQNGRRIRQWLGHDRAAAPSCSPGDVDGLFEAINSALLCEGLIEAPLSRDELFDLVDPHARGAGAEAGFDPASLLSACLPGYDVLMLTFSDYLGESARHVPVIRGAADSIFRYLAPRSGALFSWLIRKPGVEAVG